MNRSETVAIIVAIGIALLVLVVVSLRGAFSKPAPSLDALRQFSLAIGRMMLLVAWLVGFLPATRLHTNTTSGTLTVGAAAGAALIVAMLAERRWPRQTGTVRIAQAVRRSYRGTVRQRYVLICAAAAAVAAVALVFRTLLRQLQSIPDFTGVAFGAGMLLVMVCIGVLALRVVVNRPALAGVDPDGDQKLRQLAAERVLRAMSAAFLVFAIEALIEVNTALGGSGMQVVSLTDGLSTFLEAMSLALGIAVFLLYAVGPTALRIKRLLPAKDAVAER